MTFRPPLDDMLFCLRQTRALAGAQHADGNDSDVTEAVLAEAARFAQEVIAPLNRVGDIHGATLANGVVTTPPGWRDAYRAWTEAGWNGLAAPEAWGGQDLPRALNAACTEMWNGASLAFGLAPILTMGAIEALTAHGSDVLKQAYLPRLVSGAWTGTMLLTEPQAGSDVGALRTRAERAGDGSYRLTGQKIFITYGDHDLTDNIVHLVLARLPDAPAGTRGISLFLVPKFLPDAEGRPGARNDIHVHSLEHKLGIHGSPTCTMVLGDDGGATGFLIGEEHRGMACMFTMMNQARLAVGLQGVAIAERATQQALAFARERRQGRAPDGTTPAPIIAHPDVRRMLLTMQALTRAARAICYATAAALDRAATDPDAEALASLLTPVAKAFATDIGVEVASLGIQVHGGMGFIEETGAAQHLRDARILPIYEGTNGIQAIDLILRKLPLNDGTAVAGYLDMLDGIVASLKTGDATLAHLAGPLAGATGALRQATEQMARRLTNDPSAALAGATPYLRLFGITAGGCYLAHEALTASREADTRAAERIGLATFYAYNIAVQADGLVQAALDGAASVNDPHLLPRTE